jgi:hypothetical protein
MNHMAFSGFYDKTAEPAENELAAALGPAGKLWHELRLRIASEFAPLTEEWVFSGKNYGWSLRLKQKKRAVLYMKPLEGHFRVSFAFGEKAVKAAHQSGLPASVLKLIDNGPKYPEGWGVRMEVRGEKDVRTAVKLAGIKMAN